MDILAYAIPGLDIPLAALACFLLAILAFALTKAGPLGELIGLAAAALGTAVALIGGGDLTLLAALEMLTLCAYLIIARIFFPKKKRREGNG